jgi:hypothetical protein
MGWYGGGAVGRSQTRPPNRTENALGLPLRCEAEAATASSPTLRPRREVLPPSESTHARDHATFSEDPCGPICGSRASPSSSGRIRSMIPVDDPSKWVELRTRRCRSPALAALPSVIGGRGRYLEFISMAEYTDCRATGSDGGIPERDRRFESTSLQRRAECEPDLAPWNRSPRPVPWPVFRRHALDPADVW